MTIHSKHKSEPLTGRSVWGRTTADIINLGATGLNSLGLIEARKEKGSGQVCLTNDQNSGMRILNLFRGKEMVKMWIN